MDGQTDVWTDTCILRFIYKDWHILFIESYIKNTWLCESLLKYIMLYDWLYDFVIWSNALLGYVRYFDDV